MLRGSRNNSSVVTKIGRIPSNTNRRRDPASSLTSQSRSLRACVKNVSEFSLSRTGGDYRQIGGLSALDDVRPSRRNFPMRLTRLPDQLLSAIATLPPSGPAGSSLFSSEQTKPQRYWSTIAVGRNDRDWMEPSDKAKESTRPPSRAKSGR
jgi:hypothetical protein